MKISICVAQCPVLMVITSLGSRSVACKTKGLSNIFILNNVRVINEWMKSGRKLRRIAKKSCLLLWPAYYSCCYRFSSGKWDIPVNTADVTDMVKTAATCFLYMLIEIEFFIKYYSEIEHLLT